MTFSPGQHVQMRRDVGVVSQVLARGYAYRVAFPDGQEFVCLKEVLKPAPENVTVFRPRDVASPSSAGSILHHPGSFVSERDEA